MYSASNDTPRRLAVDVAEHFGFDFTPFGLLTGPEEFLVTEAHRTLLKILYRAATASETVAVMAEPGSGKTVGIAWALDQLEQRGVRVIRIDPTDGRAFTISKLKTEILRALEVRVGMSVSDKRFRVELAKASRGVNLLLAMDNAHEYNRRTLVALRRINEQPFAMRQRLIGMVLSGYPTLDMVIRDKGELNSRIMRYRMQEPRSDDIKPYIKKRLESVNGTLDVFSPEAIAYLVEKQQVEREPLRFGELNMSLSRALYEAAILGEHQVSGEIMAEADLRPEDTGSLFERAGRPDRRKLCSRLGLQIDLVYREIESGGALPLPDRNRLRRALRALVREQEKRAA